ncbi:Pyruvate kinase, putative [Perkinsus marinus ATCC 50983]|uniref:Pyruvate kinase n=1 Tax=Perkinsus marinus (strain ATCC 50983 / TXsc) TaxID=423536 RepID=C5LLU7_PERM5|nr:Pyruvate kinase, putative [Perkinsus marinus ATCC 50983]EER02319.1 Pyruvate kinase, putative [Perkinsus marinus ATCC 50983]|eukprot:XP_002769601.1 Pyruvate kinase, putative [Perkinsus marinus ATCC 50983]
MVDDLVDSPLARHGFTGRCVRGKRVLGQTHVAMGDDLAGLSVWTENCYAPDPLYRKTKLICTMGPSCWDVDTLVKMIDQGMNVARFNFSHGDFETHSRTLRNLMDALRERPNKDVAVMLDTKGPEIRSGFFAAGGKVELEAGQDLILTTDYSFKGDAHKIACTYEKLPQSVKPGSIILMADGTVNLEVVECYEDSVKTRVLNHAIIGERKNMNLPGVRVDLPCIGEKEANDILNWGLPNGIDFIAVSFVQHGDDIRELRKVLGSRGRKVQIISKIESTEGLRNFDDILEASDAIMIARGDLGMEMPPEKVFLAQKMMTARCNLAGKPVITATQMLESMIENPRPTRAEVSDVANAVLDGSDGVMLSGESASGKFPISAVHFQRSICEVAEHSIDHDALYCRIRQAVINTHPQGMCYAEAVCTSAVKAALECDASLIIALTETGNTARLIAKYRPPQQILALSRFESTVKHLSLCRGVIPLQVPSFQGSDHILHNALAHATQMGMCRVGDKVVAVHGRQDSTPRACKQVKILVVE